MNKIEEKINEILDKVRPYLNQDGGDVSFVSFKDGICYVKLSGACAGCLYADVTIQDNVEEILVSEIPEVIKVVRVDD